MSKIVQIDYKKESKKKALDKNNILRNIAKEVSMEEFGSPELQKIITEMQEACDKEQDGVAIAAPQIGISKKIFLIKEKSFKKNAKWKPLIFINPKIIKTSKKKQIMQEGCLSVRPFYGDTLRYTSVTIEAKDFTGNKFSFGATGLLAQIFQHEIDHLEGKLFIDHATNISEFHEEKE